MTLADFARTGSVAPVLLPDPATKVATGYTSDLLSDVVANCPADAVLITLQAHANTVAACVLVGAAAVLVCGGRRIPEDMLAAARREGMEMMTTPLNQFEASCAVQATLLAHATTS